MSRRPVIAIVGAGRDVEPAISNARELGQLIAQNGWVLITGGRDAGVMKTANEGAKAAKDSLTIGILPNRSAPVSSSVDVAIVTDMGQARNNIIVMSADLVVACGVDGPGTASEVALAIKGGKQVILLCANDETKAFFKSLASDRIETAETPADAIAIAASLISKTRTSQT